MTQSKSQRLIAVLKERSVRTGTFTLASGKQSDLYVDARLTTLHPEGAHLIAALILERLHQDIVGVGGPMSGADPITGAVVHASFAAGRPLLGFMVRKAVKAYGTKSSVEGVKNLEEGSPVCVVEDTVTTGGSMLRAVERCVEAGLNVRQCIAIVDRTEGAVERFAEAGYTLESLVQRSDLM